jgi:histidine triad (HIT) family protein
VSDCIFCRIARHEAPADVVFEDGDLLAFRDIDPKAPVHILLIPKKHIESLETVGAEDQALFGKMVVAARDLARKEGVAPDGYRLVINTNRGAGQSVWHLHLHLMGGRPLGWPPG